MKGWRKNKKLERARNRDRRRFKREVLKALRYMAEQEQIGDIP